MVSYFNKRFFLKLGLISGISAGGINFLVWLVINSFESWGPSKSEVILSAAWSTSIGMFFNLIIFSSLLGFVTKYLQSSSRVILGAFVIIGLISGIILNIFSDFSTFDFAVMIGFVIPLTIFYRGVESKNWYNWIKLVAFVIVILIVYEYVTLNMFTHNRFQYFNSAITRWWFAFLAYGPPLMATIYIYHKTLGRFYKIDDEIGKMKLKNFLKHFYQNDIVYTLTETRH